MAFRNIVLCNGVLWWLVSQVGGEQIPEFERAKVNLIPEYDMEEATL